MQNTAECLIHCSRCADNIITDLSFVLAEWLYSGLLPTSCLCHAGGPGHHQEEIAKADAVASGSSTVPSAIWLYATLSFAPIVPEAASRFEVFYRINAGESAGSSSVALAASWMWLGTTEISQFRVTQLEVPVSATSVAFAVQVADVLGKLTPFENATFATLPRP